MSAMIERVARILCRDAIDEVARQRGLTGDEARRLVSPLGLRGLVDYLNRNWREYEGSARGVIEAMREPTSQMKDAAAFGSTTKSDGGEDSFDYISDEDAGEVWEKMIDEALR